MEANRIGRARGWIVVAALLLVADIAWASPSFSGLGDLLGDTYQSSARSISADGSTVVGESRSAAGTEAFRWRRDDGMVGLGVPGGGDGSSYAYALSADGSRIVGSRHDDVSDSRAVAWEDDGSITDLGDISSSPECCGGVARAISADGSIVGGTAFRPAGLPLGFRHTESAGLHSLNSIEGPEIFSSQVSAMSADGATFLVAPIYGLNSGTPITPFTWTASGGFESLGQAFLDSASTYGTDLSADGSTVVGFSNRFGAAQRAYRWTREMGFMDLGESAGEACSYVARGTSADGSVIVGGGRECGNSSEAAAFIWDHAKGMQSLQDVLDELDVDTDGWTLIEATGLSDDGGVIAGWGINPDGHTEAWVAVVPEPSTGVLLSIGLIVLGKRRPSAGTRKPGKSMICQHHKA